MTYQIKLSEKDRCNVCQNFCFLFLQAHKSMQKHITMNRPTTLNAFCNLLNSYDIFVMRICSIIKLVTGDKHCSIQDQCQSNSIISHVPQVLEHIKGIFDYVHE